VSKHETDIAEVLAANERAAQENDRIRQELRDAEAAEAAAHGIDPDQPDA
jgi:GrpB-like predicted nucleotidyltransferase (UPF0157 family)